MLELLPALGPTPLAPALDPPEFVLDPPARPEPPEFGLDPAEPPDPAVPFGLRAGPLSWLLSLQATSASTLAAPLHANARLRKVEVDRCTMQHAKRFETRPIPSEPDAGRTCHPGVTALIATANSPARAAPRLAITCLYQ